MGSLYFSCAYCVWPTMLFPSVQESLEPSVVATTFKRVPGIQSARKNRLNGLREITTTTLSPQKSRKRSVMSTQFWSVARLWTISLFMTTLSGKTAICSMMSYACYTAVSTYMYLHQFVVFVLLSFLQYRIIHEIVVYYNLTL